MIEERMTEAALWQRGVLGADGKKKPDAGTQIKVQKIYGFKVVRGADGNEFASTMEVRMNEQPSYGDRIDGRMVLDVRKATNLDGQLVCWCVFVE